MKQCFILVVLIPVLFSCGPRSVPSSAVRPDILDGVYSFDFGRVPTDLHLIGNWTVPRKASLAVSSRVAEFPGAGLSFYSPAVQPVVIRIEADSDDDFDILINGHTHRIPQKDPRIVLKKENILPGKNILTLLPKSEQKIYVKNISIHPVGFLLKKKREDPLRIFPPASVRFYMNPAAAEKLLVTFTGPGIGTISANLVIESEKSETRKVLRMTDKPIHLLPMDDSVHRFTFHFSGKSRKRIAVSRSVLMPRTNSSRRTLEPPDKKKMNVLLILLDAARADHFGVYGYHRNTTPNIDAFSRHALVFENCFSEAAYTLASTATLITGIPPDLHGVLSPLRNRMKDQMATVAGMFKSRGYFTGAISANAFFGHGYKTDRGFESFVELYDQKQAVVNADKFTKPFTAMLQSADANRKPFYIHLHLREPHTPYSMPPPFLGTFQNKHRRHSTDLQKKFNAIYFKSNPNPEEIELVRDLYDENLLFADHVVGDLLRILEHRGLSKHTMVIITADHGEALGEHGEIGHNVVLLREGIHIPLIVKIPGYSNETVFVPQPAITSDIVVTLAQTFDLNYPHFPKTQGRNLFRLPESRTRFCRSVPFLRGYSWFMAETHPFKLIFRTPIDAAPTQLFHMERDPAEQSPLTGFSLTREYLIELLNQMLTRDRIRPGIHTPDLSEKDLENLKSLGYLQ